MVTREDLKGYRAMEREAREKRALMRQAELAANESGRENDRKRALALARQYEKIAKEQEKKTARSLRAIESISAPNFRRVLYYRYIKGWSRTKTAVAMGVSERTVSRLTSAALKMLKKSKSGG